MPSCSGGGGGSVSSVPPVKGATPQACSGAANSALYPARTDPSGRIRKASATPVDTNGSDWPQFRRDNQRTANNPYQTSITLSNVSTLKIKWTQIDRGVFANAVVMNNTVYQADDGGDIFAWKLSDGSRLWSYTNSLDNVHFNDAFVATPAYSNNTLFVADTGYNSRPGSVRAINATTGQQLWQFTDSWPGTKAVPGFQGSPLLANGYVYEGQTEIDEAPCQCIPKDQLLALNPSSGALASSLTLTHNGGDGDSVWSSPTQDPSGDIYVATSNTCDVGSPSDTTYADSVLKLTNHGLPPLGIEWGFQSQVPNNALLDLDFGSTPLYVKGLIIQGGKDGYTYAIDASNGKLVWKYQTGGVIASPATDGVRVYVAAYATAAGECAPGQNPCGGLYAFDAATGAVDWFIPTAADKYGNGILSAPAVSNGIVFDAIGSTIYAFNALTGAQLWSYTTQHTIYQGMAVVNGGLLVGEWDGATYYCFTPNGQ